MGRLLSRHGLSRRLGLTAATALLAWSAQAQPADAKVSCRLDLSTHVLSVKSSGGLLDEPVLRRQGDRIVVYPELLSGPLSCHGSPTVTNTDTIDLTLKNIGDGEVDLGGGPLAPGATPEPGSVPEIEVIARGTGALFLEGGRRADHFRYSSTAGERGLNLNAGPGDVDADVIAAAEHTELFADGGAGDDLIEVPGHSSVEVIAFGGPGDDTLYARHGSAPNGALLGGGGGDDRIIGGPDGETVSPGPGRDTVKTGAGGDYMGAKPDGAVDRIDCGPGRDQFFRQPFLGGHKAAADRFDHVRSCGRVTRATPGRG
jgi:hypothetical protein